MPPDARTPEPAELLLDLRSVHVAYGKIEALRGVSLELRRGEIVALIGANGAGKTTVLRTVSCLRQPTRGEVWLRGERIDRLRPHQIVVRGVSQAPEGRGIFGVMSVADNLAMGAHTRRDRAAVDEDYDRVYGLFPVLKDRRRQSGGTLSGGEQQMLAIGRALMARPEVLLLDEPSLGLAPLLVQQILSIIEEINAQGTAILLVEQNAHAALRRAARAYVLESGRVTLSGVAASLLEDESVQRAYLGGDVGSG
ncbi:MAG: ABC transporter ATP-binding protein [Acidimicrobiia bacterium]